MKRLIFNLHSLSITYELTPTTILPRFHAHFLSINCTVTAARHWIKLDNLKPKKLSISTCHPPFRIKPAQRHCDGQAALAAASANAGVGGPGVFLAVWRCASSAWLPGQKKCGVFCREEERPVSHSLQGGLQVAANGAGNRRKYRL